MRMASEDGIMNKVLPLLSENSTQIIIAFVILFAPLLFGKWLRRILYGFYERHQLERLRKSGHGEVVGTVSALYIYPVKSLKPVPVTESHIDSFGLVNDRRFMVVHVPPSALSDNHSSPNKTTHRFLSQRICPSLTSVTATLSSNGSTLILSSPHVDSGTPIKIPLDDTKTKNPTFLRAGLWDSTVTVQDMGSVASSFLTSLTKRDNDTLMDVRLVAFLPTHGGMESQERYTPPGACRGASLPSAALTDEYPLTIVTTSSLKELNRRLEAKGVAPIPMIQFRPNIVITLKEDVPFAEDNWRAIEMGGRVFRLLKAHPRCKQSCTDQTTGAVSEEPLQTLGEFRKLAGGNSCDVYFSSAAICQQTDGFLEVGMEVRVLKTGDPIW